MFTLTDVAARQIQQAASASGAQEMALRVAATRDTAGGVQYGMGFDDPTDSDMKLDLQGVAVVIAEEYQQVLDDVVLDYVELTPGAFHFIFMNAREFAGGTAPASSGGCSSGGCGGGGCGSRG